MPNQMQKEKPQEEAPKPSQIPTFTPIDLDPVDELLKELEEVRDRKVEAKTVRVARYDSCGCFSHYEDVPATGNGGF